MSCSSSHPTPRTASRTSTKRVLAIAISPLLFAAAIWFAWFWWTEGRFIETTDDAYVGGDVTTLSSKIAGFIEKVSVIDNQPVHAGDLLVKLDDRDYRAQLARAQASVAAQTAALANLDATRRLQKSMIDQAEADIAATVAELARARYDFDRYRTLSNDRFASAFPIGRSRS
jgi:membrane fusion protein (multidrug efflux system)